MSTLTSAARPSPIAKLHIHFIELRTGIDAFYNPKEITIQKQIPWSPKPSPKAELADLEYAGAGTRSMSLELFFDTYETGENVHAKYISKLETGTAVMEKRGDKQRPPTCLITWGEGFPKLVGVIESLTVKYTMFFGNGTPCRAVATIAVKEASRRGREGDDDAGDHRGSDRRSRAA